MKSFCEYITTKYEPNINTEASAFDIYFRQEFWPSSNFLLDSIHFCFMLFVLPQHTLCVFSLYNMYYQPEDCMFL